MNKNTVISVKNLYKIYRLGDEKVRALNGVTLTINRGEFAAIVGKSGSGKSTMLNMLAGLEKPTRGEIIIAGSHIENMSESQLVRFRRAHVGFIFQSYNLMPSMDAVENVSLPLVFRGVSPEKRHKAAIKALKRVGLSRYLHHRPTQMSGGQQQRVGIARALVSDPEIIFADEPTGNLDSATTDDILQLMKEVVSSGKNTLIMVTHDNYLATFADRLIRIKDGRLDKSSDDSSDNLPDNSPDNSSDNSSDESSVDSSDSATLSDGTD